MRLPGEDIKASDFCSLLTMGETLTGASTPQAVYQDGEGADVIQPEMNCFYSADYSIDNANKRTVGTFKARGTKLTSISLMIWRSAGPLTGNVTVNIYAADVNDKPTGASLGSKTLTFNSLPGAQGTPTLFTFDTEITTTVNNQYAAVVNFPEATGTYYIHVGYSGNKYNPDSKYGYSTDGGSTWTVSTDDLWFVAMFHTPTAPTGKIYNAKANDANKLKWCGFTVSSGNADANGWVIHTGPVDGFANLIPGAAYYLQDDGTIGPNPGTYQIPVGEAKSASRLLINKEERRDERWTEQIVRASQPDNAMASYDFAFDENRENFYFLSVYYASTYQGNIYHYKKDKLTGKFIYCETTTLAGSIDSQAGITVSGGYVYGIYRQSNAFFMRRWNLDMSNITTITQSGYVANENGAMTSIGDTFFIADNSGAGYFGVYKMVGTVLTRISRMYTSGLQNYINGMSNDGTYIYCCTSAQGLQSYPYQYFQGSYVKRFPIYGGTGASVLSETSGLGTMGLIRYGKEMVSIHNLIDSNNSGGTAFYLRVLHLSRVTTASIVTS